MKKCSKCKETKDFGSFYKNKAQKDGFANYCKGCIKPIIDAWEAVNTDKLREKSKKWRLKNPEKRTKWQLAYQKRHADKTNHRNAKRRASKIDATPSWLTKQHLVEIHSFYTKAKELEPLNNDRFDVDHIIPLNGQNVCGLHVPWNLQVLTKIKNCQKGNKVNS